MTPPPPVNPRAEIFEPGSLWRRITTTAARALEAGALEPIRTETTYCEEQRVRFLIRVVSSLRDKPAGSDDHNPFLPYERALHVADASNTHACILNKYNVVDHHLLITTLAFEHQETLLKRADFQALWKCLIEFDSLGFYNSGMSSGASQKHKHLQLVPLPLIRGGSKLQSTLRGLLDAFRSSAGKLVQVETLPFRHVFVRLDERGSQDLKTSSETSVELYLQMLQQAGMGIPSGAEQLIGTPYNLLVTRRWMLLVPRLQECFEGISLNSLAFLGALLVQDRDQLQRLRRAGPFAALKAVTLGPA